MSGFMPYVVEKGPYLSVLEDKLADPLKRRQVLLDLQAGRPLSQLVGFDSTNLGTPPPNKTGDGMTAADRQQHLDDDWFGINRPPFWVGYTGDTQSILRAATARAIEVSFGLEHGAAVPPDDEIGTGRHWPIDFYWICQGPWFQCWVLWRRLAPMSDDGHVTVLITTPVAYGYPLSSKITRPVLGSAPYNVRDYASPPEANEPPPRPDLEKGVWVVGHEDYAPGIVLSTKKMRIGHISFPTGGWVPKNPEEVKCVAPSEPEGGVLDAPRKYQP